jgi:NAD(P)H-dependent FMN reductase
MLSGSPRKNGNTERILARIGNQIEKNGHQVELIRLARLAIRGCQGCGGCEQSGNCVIDDDMQELYPRIAGADVLVLSSPIYFYGLSGQAKLFIDRCQALWSRKYLLKQPISSRADRRGYLVCTAATRGEQLFVGARLCARYGLDAMDIRYEGELFFTGVDKQGAIDRHPDFPQKADLLAGQILANGTDRRELS